MVYNLYHNLTHQE